MYSQCHHDATSACQSDSCFCMGCLTRAMSIAVLFEFLLGACVEAGAFADSCILRALRFNKSMPGLVPLPSCKR